MNLRICRRGSDLYLPTYYWIIFSSSSSPSKKTIIDNDEVDELIKLKSHVQELNEKIKYSTQQLSLASIKEAEFTEVEAQLKANISEAKEKSKKELEARESEFKIKIVQLEAEIHKQRDRYIFVF